MTGLARRYRSGGTTVSFRATTRNTQRLVATRGNRGLELEYERCRPSRDLEQRSAHCQGLTLASADPCTLGWWRGVEKDEPVPPRRRIEHRTAQLPVWSRILYKIEHYTALPAVALVATAAVLSLVVAIAIFGFPTYWVAAFELSASSITLIVVFAIQHTQGREQAATQRKLDELIEHFPERTSL